MFWKKAETKPSDYYIAHKLVVVDEEHYDMTDTIRQMLVDLSYFRWELVSVIETTRPVHTRTDEGMHGEYIKNERHYYFKRTTEAPEHPYHGHDHYGTLVEFYEECEHRADVKLALDKQIKT